MEPSIAQALRAGRAAPHRRSAAARVLLAGAAGALGSAVLEHLLVGRAFVQVGVLVTQPLGATLAGLDPVVWHAGADAALALDGVSTAVVVFDRERHANGREQAFWRPAPTQLPQLAASLHAAGVRHLLVVLPHDPAALPQALRRGLANLDEQAVSALGFDHLVFMRAAQVTADARPDHPGDRLARWMLAQLQLMLPQRDRPVRAARLGAFAAEVAAQLAGAPLGTRVLPPELVWEAAQVKDLARLTRDWLNGREVTQHPAPPMRL